MVLPIEKGNPMKSLSAWLSSITLTLIATNAFADDKLWVVYEGAAGPGKGKHIVLVAGDEEYRSEEALPQLGKILAKHHGFKCTVLFPIDPKTGEIHPNNSNIPGLEALKSADLMIMSLRFRNLPDSQMQFMADYIESGKPIIGMRTSTHAFNNAKNPKFNRYHWTNGDKDYKGGFGKQVLGETWVAHHGAHGRESTRGILVKGQEKHPILKGIQDGDIWGPTDVYTVTLPLQGCEPLVLGQVLTGMKFKDPPVEGKKNDPMMPVAWTRNYVTANGQKARVFNTTMGAATDLVAEGTRRLLVNASYWALGMENAIPESSNVEIVGPFNPTNFGFNTFRKGVRPADHEMK